MASRARTMLVWSGAGALVWAGATALNAHFARAPGVQGTEPSDPVGALVIGLFAIPFGATVGLAGAWMTRRFGERGGVAVLGMSVAALVTGIGVFVVLRDHPLDPHDFGWPLTSWLWKTAEWGGSIFYLLTVPIDFILFIFMILLGAIAIAIGPPASAWCCAFTIWLPLAGTFLLLERRKARAG